MGIIIPSHQPSYPWWIRLMMLSQKRKFGEPLEPILYWGRVSRAFFGFLWMISAFKRKASPISKSLQAIVRLRISQLLNCPFCIDMNLSEAYHAGLSQKKMEELANYQNSSLYDENEKLVLNYAQAVVRSDKEGCAKYLQNLKNVFSSDVLIELTALISHQAMSALFNSALGIQPHGFCQIQQKP